MAFWDPWADALGNALRQPGNALRVPGGPTFGQIGGAIGGLAGGAGGAIQGLAQNPALRQNVLLGDPSLGPQGFNFNPFPAGQRVFSPFQDPLSSTPGAVTRVGQEGTLGGFTSAQLAEARGGMRSVQDVLSGAPFSGATGGAAGGEPDTMAQIMSATTIDDLQAACAQAQADIWVDISAGNLAAAEANAAQQAAAAMCEFRAATLGGGPGGMTEAQRAGLAEDQRQFDITEARTREQFGAQEARIREEGAAGRQATQANLETQITANVASEQEAYQQDLIKRANASVDQNQQSRNDILATLMSAAHPRSLGG